MSTINCNIQIYGNNIPRVTDTSRVGAKVYTESTWGGSNKRTGGFIPSQPAESTAVNTALVHCSVPSYIFANVITSRAGQNNVSTLQSLSADGASGTTASSSSIMNHVNSWINLLTTTPDGTTSFNSSFILDNEITTRKIADQSILNSKIADVSATNNGVEHNKLAQDCIYGSHSGTETSRTKINIKAGSISGNDIGSDTLEYSHLKASSVKGSATISGHERVNIIAKSINSNDIADDSISQSVMATDSVYGALHGVSGANANIKAGTIGNADIHTSAKIASSKVDFTNGVLFSDGTTETNKWKVYTSGTTIYFSYNGSNIASLSSSGDFTILV